MIHIRNYVLEPQLFAVSAKDLTFKACDADLLRVKVKRRRRKPIHTVTHWRSPRLEHKNKDCSKSVVELAVDRKRSRMLEEQNTPARTQKKTKLTLCTRCRMYEEYEKKTKLTEHDPFEAV
jgi:2-oxoglutarate dehydrogenase complex dehydrogenase (E1) component-like enzyme